MGEIGINRHEYLYELTWWELNAIAEGYDSRNKHMWSAVRWQTFQIMGTIAGKEAMHSSGLFNPTDLLKLPWEADELDAQQPINDPEYIAEMQALIAETNESNRRKG